MRFLKDIIYKYNKNKTKNATMIELSKKNTTKEAIIKKIDKSRMFRVAVKCWTYTKPTLSTQERISHVNKGDVITVSELHISGKHKCYKSNVGYINARFVEEIFKTTNFARVKSKTKIKKYRHAYNNIIWEIPEGVIVTVECKLKDYTRLIYKDKAGYILNDDLEEIEVLTLEEQQQLLRDTIIYNSRRDDII